MMTAFQQFGEILFNVLSKIIWILFRNWISSRLFSVAIFLGDNCNDISWTSSWSICWISTKIFKKNIFLFNFEWECARGAAVYFLWSFRKYFLVTIVMTWFKNLVNCRRKYWKNILFFNFEWKCARVTAGYFLVTSQKIFLGGNCNDTVRQFC